MSSFASRAREEIAQRSIQKDCCVRAAAYGIACFAKYFDAKGLVVQTEQQETVQAAQQLFARCGVQLLALRCAGFSNVDMQAAAGKLRVVRVPAYSPHAVAEHTMGLLLTLNRRLHRAYIRTRDFNFSIVGLTGIDLYKKTVGIVGTGRIGRAFAEICRGFGMRVLAYDKYPAPDFEYVSLDTLLR